MSYNEACSTYTCNPNYGLTCGGTGCSCPTTISGSYCDCPTTHYWDSTNSICTIRSSNLGACTTGLNYQCTYNSGLTCVGSQCICATANTYWTGTICR